MNDSADANELALPHAAVLLIWTSAYLRGDIGPDDAAQIAANPRSMRTSGSGAKLFTWMTSLRQMPLAEARLVLPRPGRIAGLMGPPEAITDAIGVGQAIVVGAGGIPDHTLIPVMPTAPIGSDYPDPRVGNDEGATVVWRRHAATADAQWPPNPSSGGARESFVRALQAAVNSGEDLDLVPEEIVEVRRAPHGWVSASLPRHLSPDTIQILVLAARTAVLADDELMHASSATVSSSAQDRRREILEELREASAAALVEVVNDVVRAQLDPSTTP